MQTNVQSSGPRAQDSRFGLCRPFTATSFDIEARLAQPGIEIQVQRYQWDEPLMDGVFKPPVYYLDLALIPRVREVEAAWMGMSGMSRARGPVYAPVGDCVFIPAGHEIRAHNPAVQHRILACLFDADRLNRCIDIGGSRLDLAASFNIRNPHIRACLARLAEEALAPGFASDVLVDSTVTAMIVELIRHLRGARATQAQAGSKLPPRSLQRIRERIESASGEWPSLAALAAECAISPRHLTRAFKNTTGRTLGEYVADVRLRQAKERLVDPGVLIKAIAYECGFRSQAAFAAAFRQATGWTPRQFRQNSFVLMSR